MTGTDLARKFRLTAAWPNQNKKHRNSASCTAQLRDKGVLKYKYIYIYIYIYNLSKNFHCSFNQMAIQRG